MSNIAEEISIKRMTRNDVPEVYQLEVSCFADPWDLDSYYGEADNYSALYFVARKSEIALGYCGMWVIVDEAHIVTLAVSPHYRRHGLGRKMLNILLGEAQKLQVTTITLEVRVGNIAARELYQHAGFSIVGIRKNYYPDNNEDALVMEALLKDEG